jgi:hypothetical protein
VEAYGLPAITSPGDFNNATSGSIPKGVVPHISLISNPPNGATNLDCTIPNTLLVTVSGSDLIDQDFLNGPVKYTPITSIMDTCAVVSSVNLLTDAEDGTIGFFSQGMPANIGALTEPYPGIVPDFSYVLPNPEEHRPDDGEYTVRNIMNNTKSNDLGAWWRIADHTTGNETGRMMVINGYEPGSCFFREQVTVQLNKSYMFSAWILNMFKVTGYADPALGDAEVLYLSNKTLPDIIAIISL